jgi:predicted transcriptional regulator
LARVKGRSRATSDKAIVEAAEMIFNGASQSTVAEHLGITEARVSQYVRMDLYKETLAKLEKIKNQCAADYAQQQVDRYNDEFEEWFKLSKTMSGVNKSAYVKLMTAVNSALDAALTETDPKIQAEKIKVVESLKNVSNLIKAANILEQQINSAFNQRLGIDELSRKLSSDKSIDV